MRTFSLKSICLLILVLFAINPFASNLNLNYNPPLTCSQQDFLTPPTNYNSVPCLSDYDAMVAFANSITNWGSTSPLILTQPMNTWDGVTLHANGCVKEINLDENYMSGTIAQELGNLSELESLHLGDNNFSGSIPAELGNLANLTYLNLDGNALSGNIPAELGNLTALTQLYFSYNQLSGNIPAEVGNLYNLTALSFNGNNLTGNIPPDFGNLINLNSLSLNNNQLSGPIPSTLGNIPLTFLALYNNQFNGCYPNELQNYCGSNQNTSTNYYISNGNNFDAPWEDFCDFALGVCSCRYLDSLTLLSIYNQIPALEWDTTQSIDNWEGVCLNSNGCVDMFLWSFGPLYANLPPEFGYLSELRILNINHRQMQGELPAELGNLQNLEALILNGNNFLIFFSVIPEASNSA